MIYPKIKTGQITGTGAALFVETDFAPQYICVINKTQSAQFTFIHGMADASASKQASAADTAYITTNGITPGTTGFTLGTDTALNTASDEIHWYAAGV